jgi:two-component system CheB/CheR fusion protein
MERPREPDGELYVVGIGASAGGLDALRELFSSMPAYPGMAFVVVVHLSPEHESHLVGLLQPSTSMPVQQVTETVALERNRVYVIPPNANLDAIDTHLRLSPLERRRLERAPIDHFLRTLADAHDGTAVGVILTGTGSDGALGLRQIKERSGLTIVQDPHEAQFDSMPRTAIGTGMVDLVLPVRQIGNEIVRFCFTRPRLPIADASNGIAGDDGNVLQRILQTVLHRTGHDLGVYTRATMLKRLRKRMQLRHVDTLPAYLEIVHAQPEEALALGEDLATSASEFFGEPEHFDRLARSAIPRMFDGKPDPRDRLRVWSIGCASGEVAYSLAMLMIEEADRREASPHLQIFASDLSHDVLKRAREGAYPEEVAATVTPARLERFFKRESGSYRVRREVRDIVVFAVHNLFRDPPFAHIDLVVCRNLLRELQPAVRSGVLHLFHYALEAGGMLLVGEGDMVEESHLFAPVDEDLCLFRRKSGPARPFALPAALRAFAHVMPAGEGSSATPRLSWRDVAEIHRLAVEPHSPASVLVDGTNTVIHSSTRSDRFLRIPGGELTGDVLKLVREPLRKHLAAGLDLVRSDNRPWTSPPVSVLMSEATSSVVMHVEPVEEPGTEGLVLVVFDERRDSSVIRYEAESATAAVAQLEDELQRTTQRIHELLEAHRGETLEASNRHRDLSDSNAELRCVLEELESSREELQAANEELVTLDEENRVRLDELAQISGDLQHLLESTGVATLFLDRELQIVRFTPQLAELFNIRHTDVGRPLPDLTHDLHYGDFEEDAKNVLDTVVPLDREVESSKGRWFLMRMLPYRTAARKVDGLVLTFVDITSRKRAEQALREGDRRKDEFLAVLAHELRNPLAPIMTGVEILKARGDDPRLVEQVTATIARQARQLARLVDDLLEVSRISGGKLHLRKANVRLADVIRDAIATVRPLVESSRHELVVDMPQQPIVLGADAARLTQVFANLLNNAARYTPEGGRLGLSVRIDGDDAVVVVKDNGIGIPAHVVGHVFEMFYQGGDERQSGGLGIGLTLARSLVELHGGSIDVASEGEGRGSEFTVRLPISRAALPRSPRAAPSPAPTGRRRVLIVDDNVDAAETLRELMTVLGAHDVRTASSGEQGLRIAADVKPEIVLLDLKMPEMDGYEVARRIRQEPWGRHVMLVALTGWGQDEHRRRTREAGFDRHLTKPAALAELQSVLAEA